MVEDYSDTLETNQTNDQSKCIRPVGFLFNEWSDGMPRTTQSYNCSPYLSHPELQHFPHHETAMGRPSFFNEPLSEGGSFSDYPSRTTSAFPESTEDCQTFQRALNTSRSLSAAAAVAAVAAAYISSTPGCFHPPLTTTTSSSVSSFPIASVSKEGGMYRGGSHLKNFPFTYDRMHEFQAEMDEYNAERMRTELTHRSYPITRSSPGHQSHTFWFPPTSEGALFDQCKVTPDAHSLYPPGSSPKRSFPFGYANNFPASSHVEEVGDFRQAPSTSGSSTTTTTSSSKNKLEKVPTHVKKPLNAFMLFMKEMRAKVVAECTMKESAAINQILGKKWHALTREEQAKFYEMARREKEIHQHLYPGWSARDNYAFHAKRRKSRCRYRSFGPNDFGKSQEEQVGGGSKTANNFTLSTDAGEGMRFQKNSLNFGGQMQTTAFTARQTEEKNAPQFNLMDHQQCMHCSPPFSCGLTTGSKDDPAFKRFSHQEKLNRDLNQSNWMSTGPQSQHYDSVPNPLWINMNPLTEGLVSQSNSDHIHQSHTTLQNHHQYNTSTNPPFSPVSYHLNGEFTESLLFPHESGRFNMDFNYASSSSSKAAFHMLTTAGASGQRSPRTTSSSPRDSFTEAIINEPSGPLCMKTPVKINANSPSSSVFEACNHGNVNVAPEIFHNQQQQQQQNPTEIIHCVEHGKPH